MSERPEQADSVPFSLACLYCDRDDHPGTYDGAIAAGWTDIRYDDGEGWNFLGNCPECLADEDRREKGGAP